MRIDTLSSHNKQTQGVQRREWLRVHAPQHLQQCRDLILHALQYRTSGTSQGTLILGAGACTEVPLAEVTRASDEVVLVDLDLAAIQCAGDELLSPVLRKRMSLLQCDISGDVSGTLAHLSRHQDWHKLKEKGAEAVFDVAAQCLQQCSVPNPPDIQNLGAGEFGLVISSLVLSQLFSYPLLDMLDSIERVAPSMLGEQERHYQYQEAAQAFRIRIITAHLRLLRGLLDIGGTIVLLSDRHGFVFDGYDTATSHRRTIPLVPRIFADLVHDAFPIIEEAKWEWITDLPQKGLPGRGYEVVGYVLKPRE